MDESMKWGQRACAHTWPFGLRIIESQAMVDGPFEDWSEVRSPGRAARRRKRGFPQRIRIYYRAKTEAYQLLDGTLIMHPEMALKLRLHTSKEQPLQCGI